MAELSEDAQMQLKKFGIEAIGLIGMHPQRQAAAIALGTTLRNGTGIDSQLYDNAIEAINADPAKAVGTLRQMVKDRPGVIDDAAQDPNKLVKDLLAANAQSPAPAAPSQKISSADSGGSTPVAAPPPPGPAAAPTVPGTPEQKADFYLKTYAEPAFKQYRTDLEKRDPEKVAAFDAQADQYRTRLREAVVRDAGIESTITLDDARRTMSARHSDAEMQIFDKKIAELQQKGGLTPLDMAVEGFKAVDMSRNTGTKIYEGIQATPEQAIDLLRQKGATQKQLDTFSIQVDAMRGKGGYTPEEMTTAGLKASGMSTPGRFVGTEDNVRTMFKAGKYDQSSDRLTEQQRDAMAARVGSHNPNDFKYATPLDYLTGAGAPAGIKLPNYAAKLPAIEQGARQPDPNVQKPSVAISPASTATAQDHDRAAQSEIIGTPEKWSPWGAVSEFVGIQPVDAPASSQPAASTAPSGQTVTAGGGLMGALAAMGAAVEGFIVSPAEAAVGPHAIPHPAPAPTAPAPAANAEDKASADGLDPQRIAIMQKGAELMAMPAVKSIMDKANKDPHIASLLHMVGFDPSQSPEDFVKDLQGMNAEQLDRKNHMLGYAAMLAPLVDNAPPQALSMVSAFASGMPGLASGMESGLEKGIGSIMSGLSSGQGFNLGGLLNGMQGGFMQMIQGFIQHIFTALGMSGSLFAAGNDTTRQVSAALDLAPDNKTVFSGIRAFDEKGRERTVGQADQSVLTASDRDRRDRERDRDAGNPAASLAGPSANG